jgi:hypothetical protein
MLTLRQAQCIALRQVQVSHLHYIISAFWPMARQRTFKPDMEGY